MREELKPCPFCGGEARFAQGFDYGVNGAIRWVCCTKCGAMTRSDLHKTETEAAKAWNKRIEPLDCIECYECQNGAPMVPLRTCHVYFGYHGEFDAFEPVLDWVCSNCHFEISDNDNGISFADILYCPNCGAKVVHE